MKITVEISFSFKADLDDHPVVLDLVDGADVMAALRALASLHSDMSLRIFRPGGEVRAYINVLKNGGNVRFQHGFATPLREGDHLTILPPVGGG